MKFDIVVVGGSTAGFYLVKTLRAKGYTGSIGLIDREDTLPYNRYKLSKTWLTGKTLDAPIFKPESFFDENDIKLLLNTEVVAVDEDAKQVITADQQTITYGQLVLAMGAESRHLQLPNDDAEGIFYLRSYHDAVKIKQWSQQVKDVVLIGAGFIGLELASSFRKLGLNVTVVEYNQHPLGRVVGPQASEYFVKMHQEHDVNFVLGQGVTSFTYDEQHRVTGVVTDAGTTIPAQMVVVGVGAVPNTSIKADHLALGQNIVVNEYSETAVKDVYAVGDATIWPFQGEEIHVEHWEHAQSHGKNLAANLIQPHSQPYDVLPYFWTDQYDQTFEYLGHTTKWEQTFVRGDLDSGHFTIAYVDAQRVPLAILFANGHEQRDDVTELMSRRQPLDPERFADTNQPLSTL
ncbi:NAD(P)/FAD-dependent oxidoreductase [Lapidilactobacillus dextrinicus]|uniref:NAD(P)/FAD-dependent oxidoreductase n=1 Tax=Lapidilactobacillus dextrinicus TaxID=51664 RepID=UPI0022E253EA|nr:FAD-dependent oxidoreductase [Lapidilactobacillus dextrinicus]